MMQDLEQRAELAVARRALLLANVTARLVGQSQRPQRPGGHRPKRVTRRPASFCLDLSVSLFREEGEETRAWPCCHPRWPGGPVQVVLVPFPPEAPLQPWKGAPEAPRVQTGTHGAGFPAGLCRELPAHAWGCGLPGRRVPPSVERDGSCRGFRRPNMPCAAFGHYVGGKR